MKLEGTGVIVTGGASGLGGATAEYLASKGAKVTIFDLNEDLGTAHAKKIGGQFCKVNVASEEDVKAGVSKAEEAHGITRILVNCAGIIGAGKIVGRGEAMPFDFQSNTKKYLFFRSLRLESPFLALARSFSQRRVFRVGAATR